MAEQRVISRIGYSQVLYFGPDPTLDGEENIPFGEPSSSDPIIFKKSEGGIGHYVPKLREE